MGTKSVSVPLRGKYRSEVVSLLMLLLTGMTLHVSVPLRGKYRSEVQFDIWSFAFFDSKFPSPCGVNIVAKTEYQSSAYAIRHRFPSPCGVNIVAKSKRVF